MSWMDQVQLYWMVQSDAHFAFLRAGTNDEIEINEVPRDVRAVAQDEGILPATRFARGGSESTEPYS